MMEATGSCAGIENYSRYLTGRKPGEPPPTLFEYLPDDALVFADESHVSVPQIGGMYQGRLPPQGDAGRIWLPPALLHRQPPAALRGMGRDAAADRQRFGNARQMGAGAYRRRVRRAGHPPDRPDRSAGGDPPGARAGGRSAARMRARRQAGYRALVTTLTKKHGRGPDGISCTSNGMRVRYMHSDVDTLERIEIIRDLRLGAFDVLVGINLLREGLDIPECGAGRHSRRRQGRLPALAKPR
jgi:excinuclease ABC subunit B